MNKILIYLIFVVSLFSCKNSDDKLTSLNKEEVEEIEKTKMRDYIMQDTVMYKIYSEGDKLYLYNSENQLIHRAVDYDNFIETIDSIWSLWVIMFIAMIIVIILQ